MHFSRVDLPEPLWPRSPIVEPCGTSKLMSRSAQKSSRGLRSWRAARLTKRPFSVPWRSDARRKRFETASTSMAFDALT